MKKRVHFTLTYRVGQRVEVRSTDPHYGFSWRAGTVESVHPRAQYPSVIVKLDEPITIQAGRAPTTFERWIVSRPECIRGGQQPCPATLTRDDVRSLLDEGREGRAEVDARLERMERDVEKGGRR